jgi:hypothetical protein
MRFLRRGLQCTLIVIVILLLTFGGVYLWFINRPQPPALAEHPIFQGITYTRDVRKSPRPLLIHVARIDLDAPGIEFLVTPAQPVDGFTFTARTTSDFVTGEGVQLAINGDFFLPWRDHGPWNYYPHAGEGVNARGLTISRGEVVTEGYSPTPHTLFFAADNELWFGGERGAATHAISGHLMLLDAGEFVVNDGQDTYITRLHPRSGTALSQDGKTLLLVVVDGRQPHYSEGVTLAEFAAIMLEYGAYDAMNLDGGGSSTMVMGGADGQAHQLNSSIHTHIPGRERPIAVHLGVYAENLQGYSADRAP